MLNALQLACITSLTGAEMETLLKEAGVTVTKGATLNGHKRKAQGGAEIKDILTDDECHTLREYVASEATGIAKQANTVWSSLEVWFRDDSPIINTTEETSNEGVDPFAHDELGGDDNDDLDDDDNGLDGDELGDDLDGDEDLDELTEQGDDIDSLLNDDNNTPVDYDRSGMEADPDKKVFPDSEANTVNADPLDDLFG